MPSQMTPDISRYHASSRQLRVSFDYQYPFFWSKLWHIKRVGGYLFYTRNNLMHFIISSIICHIRCFQISCFISSSTCTFWLSISYILFLTKFAHIKQVARFLFCTRRNVMRLLMSNHKGKIVSNFTDKFLPVKL